LRRMRRHKFPRDLPEAGLKYSPSNTAGGDNAQRWMDTPALISGLGTTLGGRTRERGKT